MKNFLIEEYFKIHNNYASKYGKDKTLVFMEVGKFYEAYSTVTDEKNDKQIGADLLAISKKINIMRSQKDKTTDVINTENPYFLGFPTVSLFKFLDMLIESYNVIIVDQVEQSIVNGKKKVRREVTSVYTIGTYLENVSPHNTHFLICILITEERQKSGNILLCCGLSAVDLSTSEVLIHEAYSSSVDTNFALDEVARFTNSLGPKEILIYYDMGTNKGQPKMTITDIINYIEVDKSICRNYMNVDPKFSKIGYQNEMLNKIYPNNKTLISQIEYLNLNDKIYATISLMLLFDFIADKNKNLLANLSKPTEHINNLRLYMGNNAAMQLNLVDDKHNDGDNSIKFKSLFNVINQTSTSQGERYLKSTLMSPFTNSNTLSKIYDTTDEMLKNNFWKKIETNLNSIHDIDRMERRIGLGSLRPTEFGLFISSYKNVLTLADLIIKSGEPLLNTLVPHKKTLKKVQTLIDDIEKTFDLTELNKYVVLEFKTSIFKNGIHKDLDDLLNNIEMGQILMEKLRSSLTNILVSKTKKQITNTSKFITLENNTRDGYYLRLSSMRSKQLEEIISKMDKIELGDKSFDPKLLKFENTGKMSKIYFEKIDQKTDSISKNYENIDILTKTYYLEYLKYFFNEYSDVLNTVNKFITLIDYHKSCAKVSTMYNYVRPNIENKEFGFVSATSLRHPIVERIIDYDYIPHNVKIGNDELKGMLIYGLNSSGKSILMKSIGLAIVMAQSGLYVPADNFSYSPYNALFTRVSGTDNLFKGLSSFALEMMELNSIMKRADSKTLVIGDEVCRGTEVVSGNAIVAASIIKLSSLDSTFIFATHLHELSTLEEIESLKNVKSFHLKVDYDAKTDKLIYGRILCEGSGESVYGLTVARNIIHDTSFIDVATQIKNKILKRYDESITGKTSKYNKEIYVHECHVCKKQDQSGIHISPLETHHITPQKEYKEGFSKNKPHVMKNQKSNLIVLCNECHDKVHAGKLSINGYVLTSKGKSIVLNDTKA